MYEIKLFTILYFLGLWVIIGVHSWPKAENKTLWDKEEFPNPQIDTKLCGRGERKSWVCDPSNIITTLEANILDQLIDSTRDESKCACEECVEEEHDGYKISVAVVPGISKNGKSIASQSTGSRQSAALQFGTYLRQRKWRFEECEDGVVVVLSKVDRVLKMSIGTKAKEQLSEDCVNDIMRENKGRIERNESGKALKNVISQVRTVFKGTHPCTDNGFRWYYVVGPLLLVICIIVYLIICCLRGSRSSECEVVLCCAACGNS